MDEILVKDLNDIISKCEEHPNSSLQVELMNYILAREDKIRKCAFCGSHDDELKGWQKDFINEFRKYYQGILSEEIIEISIAWHLNFMGKYIPSPGLVALDKNKLIHFINMWVKDYTLKGEDFHLKAQSKLGEEICSKFATLP